MDLDHLPGHEKSFGRSRAFFHPYSAAVVLAEIAKCQAVCANCHRIRTEARRWRATKRASAPAYAGPALVTRQMDLLEALSV